MISQFPFTAAEVQSSIVGGRKLSYEMAMAYHAWRSANGCRPLGSHTDGELIAEAMHWARKAA